MADATSEAEAVEVACGKAPASLLPPKHIRSLLVLVVRVRGQRRQQAQALAAVAATRLSTASRQMAVVEVVATTERTPHQLQGVRVVAAVTAPQVPKRTVRRVLLGKEMRAETEHGHPAITLAVVVVLVLLGEMVEQHSVVQAAQAYHHPFLARLHFMQAVAEAVLTPCQAP